MNGQDIRNYALGMTNCQDDPCVSMLGYAILQHVDKIPDEELPAYMRHLLTGIIDTATQFGRKLNERS